MSEAMNRVAREPDLRPLLLKAALAPNPGTPEELAALMRKDFERYGKLVRQLNLRTD
jgi:tripartite-type tricarboxylate transporter receptor subunit TctC